MTPEEYERKLAKQRELIMDALQGIEAAYHQRLQIVPVDQWEFDDRKNELEALIIKLRQVIE